MFLQALLAAFMGTALMTISSSTEATIEERESSSTPGLAAKKVLRLFGVKDLDEKSVNVLSTWTHWIYGTLWGIVFWLLMTTGLHIVISGLFFFLIVWITAQIALPVMGVAKPTWNYGAKALFFDLFHHAVYAGGTVLAWVLIGFV